MQHLPPFTMHKSIVVILIAIFLVSCKSATETTSVTSTAAVNQVMHILDTIQNMFVDIAQSSSGSPGEIIVKTTDWVRTQPTVKDAFWYDSSYIEIELQSGLHATFSLNRFGSDSLSLNRGGTPTQSTTGFSSPIAANHTIDNKNILIYAPFVATGDVDNLYAAGELNKLVTTIQNAGAYKVILLEYDKCTVGALESFGQYGVVILSTHGMPDGFLIGQAVPGISEYDSTDAQIKELLNYSLGAGGYDKVRNGYFSFAYLENIANLIDWQTFLKKKSRDGGLWLLKINSKFIETIPSLSKTIILGNMCYSGRRIFHG